MWINTNPLGNDFIRLLTCLQSLTKILSQILIYDCERFPSCSFDVYTENINQTIRILNRNELNSFSYDNQNAYIKINFIDKQSNINMNKTTSRYDNKNDSRNNSQNIK